MALSLAAELCTYLGSQTLSSSMTFTPAAAGGNLFATFLPDQPDLAAVVMERGGLPPVMMLNGAEPPAGVSKLDQPLVQVRVRSAMTDFLTGEALTQSIFGALHNIWEKVLNPGGALFHLIYAMQSPVYLGASPTTDARQRHEWSQNFRILVENAQR